MLLFAAVAAGCGGDSDSDSGGDNTGTVPTGDATVTLQATTFEPADVSVTTGQTVVWRWAGGVQHNVNGGEDVFKSKLQTKGYFTHTFDTAGTFEFHCDVHPTTMKGTITVT